MLHFFEEKDGSLIFRENGETVMVTPWGADSFRVRAAFLGEIEAVLRFLTRRVRRRKRRRQRERTRQNRTIPERQNRM